MKTLIYAAVVMVVALGLLLFDDIRVGLPVLTVSVWTVVIMAGLFLLARSRNRSRRRLRPRSRSRNVTQHSNRHQIELKPKNDTVTQRLR